MTDDTDDCTHDWQYQGHSSRRVRWRCGDCGTATMVLMPEARLE